jgi:hypothetical protein
VNGTIYPDPVKNKPDTELKYLLNFKWKGVSYKQPYRKIPEGWKNESPFYIYPAHCRYSGNAVGIGLLGMPEKDPRQILVRQ